MKPRFSVSAFLRGPDLSAAEFAGPATLHCEAVAGPAHQTCGESNALPCFLGYIRPGPTDTAADSERMQHELRHFAEREGIALAHTYIEQFDDVVHCDWRSSAFCALLETLGYPEVDGILVPSLQHLSGFPDLAEDLRSLIESEIGVRVVTMRSDSADR